MDGPDTHTAAGTRRSPSDDGAAAAKRDLQIRHLRGKIKKLELGIGKETKLLVLRSEVEAREVRQVLVLRQELMGAKLLAVKMEGMNVMQREILLESWARAACERLARARIDDDDRNSDERY